MLSYFKNFSRLTSNSVKHCEIQFSVLNNKSLDNVLSAFRGATHPQSFHTSSPRKKIKKGYEVRRAQLDSVKSDDSIKGASSYEIKYYEKRKEDLYPTHDLPERLFDGVAFSDLPIVHLKSSKHNTIIGLSHHGLGKLIRSCGTEGFQNTRKGTNVAGQTTGYAFALRAVKKGYKNVRVLLKGFGPGRLGALKGLQLGGLNMISLTDITPDSTGLRPRKQKRL